MVVELYYKILMKRKLVLFLFLLYNPAASARYATRIYRDAIFPALCLMFFSAVAAVGLRRRLPVKKWWRWAVLYGASYGCIYLRREDGIWVLPFGAVALVITAGLLVSRQGVRTAAVKTAAMLAPAALSTASRFLSACSITPTCRPRAARCGRTRRRCSC